MENLIKDIDGKQIKTFKELVANLSPDGQGSGTIEGYIYIGDVNVFVRKHWSYAGGFPYYSDDTLNSKLGEINLGGGYCEGPGNGSVQSLYNADGIRIYDCELSI